jgi:pimeloyl-ACP methyl ester carboxylesterase
VPYLLLVMLMAGAALVSVGVVPRYRRDIGAARKRLASLEGRTLQLEAGSVEYTDVGDGPCLLVSHGIFHGCDGGQRAARDVISGHRVISPSRFGYLGSSMPASPTGADQADVFVDLLDNLEIESADVMGISAGTSAAVQLALRHPERVDHLIISSGNWPGSPTSEAPPDWAKMFYNDPTMWLLRVAAPPMMHGLMGVPEGFPHDDEQAAYVEEMLDSIFPLKPRTEGAVFDAFSSNPEINDYPLEQKAVPTLILHSKDDPLASYSAAARAAERIPGARLVGLETGGHLGLGQTARVHEAIAGFLR